MLIPSRNLKMQWTRSRSRRNQHTNTLTPSLMRLGLSMHFRLLGLVTLPLTLRNRLIPRGIPTEICPYYSCLHRHGLKSCLPCICDAIGLISQNELLIMLAEYWIPATSRLDGIKLVLLQTNWLRYTLRAHQVILLTWKSKLVHVENFKSF